MQWLIRDKNTDKVLDGFFFRDFMEAQAFIGRMGPVFTNVYAPLCETGNSTLNRMINEGLVPDDLEGILMPLMSVDEYVPADPGTDNVVLAFFIKGVPEAVVPFKNFAEKTKGVLSADYGDSDTIMNTSIVYIEMDRKKMVLDDIQDLMIQVGIVSGLQPEDFTMTFPHTSEKFPYNTKLLGEYFVSRDERENRLAQKKAERKAMHQAQKEIEKFHSQQKRDEEKKYAQRREEQPQRPSAQPAQPTSPAQPAQAQPSQLGIPGEQQAGMFPQAQQLGIPTESEEVLVDRLARML